MGRPAIDAFARREPLIVYYFVDVFQPPPSPLYRFVFILNSCTARVFAREWAEMRRRPMRDNMRLPGKAQRFAN